MRERDVKSLTEMVKDVYGNPSPCEEAISDLRNSQKIGKEAYYKSVRRRFLKDCDTQFFDTLPRTKLRSFETKVKKPVASKSRNKSS